MDEEWDEIVREFLVESHEMLDVLDRDLVGLEVDPTSADLLSSVFRTMHTIKGTSGFLELSALESVTHVGENLLVRLRDGVLAMTPQVTDVLLETVDVVRRLLAAVETTGGEDGVAVDHVVARLTAALETPAAADRATSADTCPGTSSDPVAEPVADPVAEPVAEPGARASADASVRVDVEVLDTLMRLVGELVLTRNQVLREAGEDDGALRTAQRLSGVVRDLQDGVMRTRLQPLDQLWSKMPRLVREVAAQCGKQVRLVTTGGDTELDRTLLEAVKDPLTHLVRNAVDHGLEHPDRRTASGKDATGVLRLSAHHEAGQVVVEVTDDGAGIDPVRIAATVLARGLRTPAQLADLGPHDLLQLVFLPGFSTAPEITHLSGRGVGMDVVRTNIEAIGGRIEVESTPGTGTTCRLRVPLTLAIVPALVVRCADERYVLPQLGVLELVALGGPGAAGAAGAPGGASAGAVEEVHGAPVHRLRDTLLPLVRLDDVLGAAAAATHRPGPGPDDHGLAIVLQAEGRRFGLVVDEVLSTEEVVVTALSERLRALGLCSGATILGDGGVALILDVPAIARDTFGVDAGGAPEPATVDDAEAEDPERLLVAAVGGDRLVCLPLGHVERLERTSASLVQRAGCGEVVPHQGALLPLVRLGDHLDDELVVVVCEVGPHRVALAVEEIHDVVDADATRPAGVPGVVAVEGRAVEVLDVAALAAAAVSGPVSGPGAGDPAALLAAP